MQAKKYMKALVASALFILGSVHAYAQSPVILTGGIVNAADYSTDLAPGAIFSIFGTGLATSTASAGSMPLPTFLAATSVDVVDIANVSRPCPLYFVSPGQINAQLPYSLSAGVVQIRVHNGLATSGFASARLAAAAPKLFSLNVSGVGQAITTNPAGTQYTNALPSTSASQVVMYLNSMGALDVNLNAGDAAPGLAAGSKPANVKGTVSVTVDNGAQAQVTFAGLTPGFAGLYQVNAVMPFSTNSGNVTLTVSVGTATSQTNVSIPYRPLGFYYAMFGGKAVAGQTLNGLSGANSAMALRNSDNFVWGTDGFNAWSKNTGLVNPAYSGVSGLAVTLKNGAATVFDNNGIEDNTFGTFYTNTTGPDSAKPGLSKAYSMSNYYPLVFSTYLHLTQPTTITQMIGYFDLYGDPTLPFDPTNPFVKFRMNIFSNSSLQPKETGNFVGDVFSTDTATGTFSFSQTSASRISSAAGNTPSPIDRVVFSLASPLTLPAGDYWFSHDVAIRATPASSSTAKSVNGANDTMIWHAPKPGKPFVIPGAPITQ